MHFVSCLRLQLFFSVVLDLSFFGGGAVFILKSVAHGKALTIGVDISGTSPLLGCSNLKAVSGTPFKGFP